RATREGADACLHPSEAGPKSKLSERRRCNSLPQMADEKMGMEEGVERQPSEGGSATAAAEKRSLWGRIFGGGWKKKLLLGILGLFLVTGLAGGGTFLYLLDKYGKEVPDAPDLDKWRPPIL